MGNEKVRAMDYRILGQLPYDQQLATKAREPGAFTGFEPLFTPPQEDPAQREAAQGEAMRRLTRKQPAPPAPDPELERLRRQFEAMLPMGAAMGHVQEDSGVLPYPREWKQMPPGQIIGGIDPSKLQPGDLDGQPLWVRDPELYQQMIQRLMSESGAGR